MDQQPRYRIAIVVHGRFHAFNLARALLARGHDVWLFTNYPRWAVARFGFPVERVVSYPAHGVAVRAAKAVRLPTAEPWLHRAFGRWAARRVTRTTWDCIYCFSGVAEELFQVLKDAPTLKGLIRGSAHIRVQASILEEEERRAGHRIDRPSHWRIQREEREYAAADFIVSLSTFATASFTEKEEIVTIPLGSSAEQFRPTPQVLQARKERVSRGSKLRVLFVGNKSYQKGLIDLTQIVSELEREFEFRIVGSHEPRSQHLLNRLKAARAEMVPRVPESHLPAIYDWADLFVFPTVQDGYAVVLAQAYTNGLPILATTNCGAPDLIREGDTGWILPIRSPEAFVERLRWCDVHRTELAETISRIYNGFAPRDWDDVARDHELAIDRYLSLTYPVRAHSLSVGVGESCA
jgi:glycosyltransferase involved in cell wall biosynthesis